MDRRQPIRVRVDREALDFARTNLPDHEPWRAWSNFEFIDDEGRVNEVDLLVLTPAGLVLVEIKSHPGAVTGDAHGWTWTTDGRQVTTPRRALPFRRRPAGPILYAFDTPQQNTEPVMAKLLVLYYSSYGHIETMANAVAEGGQSAGAEVDIKRVPELVPDEVARASHYKLDQAAPVAKPDELTAYDAIIVGTGTRYGRMTSQMANFWDQTGGLWAKGALIGKVGAAFTSTASQHGGQETTLMAIHTMLFHMGMVQVGLPYSFQGQMRLDEVTGGTPYGASTIAAGDGSRQPSGTELDGARFLGRHVAGIAAKLAV